MSDGVGLSVGATNLAAVVVGRTAVLRSPVLTRYPHRPPEVGVPSQNPRLNERGLILTDFVDRVGDPVGIVAADGTTHRADVVLADALRAMLYTVGGGRVPAGPVTVTHPAHWPAAAVDALRAALAAIPEFRQPKPAPVISDATAALTALQDDPGVPARGVIALCDFGGSGTSITLVDAANGYTPVGATVRHPDLSGDLVDQALLTHVIEDLSAAGTIDLTSTSAIGSLARLRAQCRGAKERLSTAAVATLVAELPGHRSEVRVTRNELDEAIRQPVDDFTAVLQDTLERNGIQNANLAAVASVGGGARIPLITTALSERFRVPVVTIGQPELAPAIGGGLAAVRGTVEEGATSMSAAPEVAAAAAAATAMAPEAPPAEEGSVGALAWSDAEDIPEVPTADPYDYPVVPGRAAEPRPAMQFDHDESWDDVPPAPLPWYRKPAVAASLGVIALLAALTAAVLFVVRGDSAPSPASTTEPMTVTPRPATTEPPPTATQPPPPPPQTVTRQAPPPVTQTITAPPPAPEPTPEPTPEPQPTTPEPPPEPPPAPEPSPAPEPEPPPWSPTPPYPTIPGLPWVPAPQLPEPPPGP